jgi:negative regulator of replication initiation
MDPSSDNEHDEGNPPRHAARHPAIAVLLAATVLAGTAFNVQQAVSARVEEQMHLLRLARDQQAVAERIGRLSLLLAVGSTETRVHQAHRLLDLVDQWRWMHETIGAHASEIAIVSESGREIERRLTELTPHVTTTTQAAQAAAHTVLAWQGETTPERIVPHVRDIDQMVRLFSAGMRDVSAAIDRELHAGLAHGRWITVALCLLAAGSVWLLMQSMRRAPVASRDPDHMQRLHDRLEQSVATATASGGPAADMLRRVLAVICKECDWPVGHVRYFVAAGAQGPAASSDVWHVDEDGMPGRGERPVGPGPVTALPSSRGAVVVPIRSGNRTIAVLDFHVRAPVDQSVVRVVRDVAQMISLAIPTTIGGTEVPAAAAKTSQF